MIPPMRLTETGLQARAEGNITTIRRRRICMGMSPRLTVTVLHLEILED